MLEGAAEVNDPDDEKTRLPDLLEVEELLLVSSGALKVQDRTCNGNDSCSGGVLDVGACRMFDISFIVSSSRYLKSDHSACPHP